MTQRSRSARVLRDVRTRLRDVAAATHAITTAQRDEAKRRLETEEDRLESLLSHAHHAFAGARTVHIFDDVAMHVGAQEHAIKDATTVHATHASRAAESHLKLVASARLLETAERIVDRIDAEAARREARNEQRANDDIAAKRKR
jgi:flagellar biosynthesis chaperone FliJ